MIYRIYFFALFGMCLFLDTPVQALDLNYAIIHSGLNTHTHISTPESKPASLEFKVASVCFLGLGSCANDALYTKDNNDLTINTGNQCIQEGFTYTSCTLPEYLEVQCPYNSNYYAKCIADNARACGESGYTKSCGSGEVLDTAQTCPYDSSYKKCKCNPCDGYSYTLVEATAQGYVADGSCQSCGVTKYKRKENPCSGYSICECGGASGAKTCYTGATLKYNSCKPCCENKCSLATCPDNHTCDYEACSNKYCDNGCAAGYTDMCLTGDTCVGMGYSQQSCVGDTLYCPYNTSYRFCLSL